jgi:hypothetical protein
MLPQRLPAVASASLPAPDFSRAENRAAATGAAPRFLTTSIALELGILLTLSVLFPFMIHLLPVPEDARLGPRLLPMFYAPLLASLLGRGGSALVVALVAPWLNTLLTGHPAPRGGIVMTIELVVFVGVLRLLLARVGGRWFLAIPAYVWCMIAATIVVACIPSLIGGRSATTWALQSVSMGLPGVGVMLLINWLAVRNYPTGGNGSAPMAA